MSATRTSPAAAKLHAVPAASPKLRRVLVIGASGPTGRLIVEAVGNSGIAVRALARDPGRLGPQPSGGDVTRGDVLDQASLARAMTEVDAVVSALGAKLELRPVTLLSAGTRNVIAAMRESGVERLVCVTGVGAGDSRGHGGFAYDRLILPTLLRYMYADKNRQEQVVHDSGLDWTIVRPARLVDAPARGTYRVITTFAGERMRTISRADVAGFIARELLEHRFGRSTVNLTY